MARALLKQRGMPTVFWGEAVVTAVYILNRSPTKALDGRTPYEAWHGRKPVVSHLRVFGCLAFAKELGHIGKLDDMSTPGVFIGYVDSSKAYRILDPKTQRVRTARDVVFNEGRGWVWDKVADDGSTPLRYRTMEDLLGDQPVPGLVSHDLEAQLHLVCDDGEPQFFVEAERDAASRATMQLEMDAVEQNRTWELAGHRANP
jgi:hypothetical protein